MIIELERQRAPVVVVAHQVRQHTPMLPIITFLSSLLFSLSQDQGLVNYCSIVDVYVKLPSFRILHM